MAFLGLVGSGYPDTSAFPQELMLVQLSRSSRLPTNPRMDMTPMVLQPIWAAVLVKLSTALPPARIANAATAALFALTCAVLEIEAFMAEI